MGVVVRRYIDILIIIIITFPYSTYISSFLAAVYIIIIIVLCVHYYVCYY